jgi:arabinoxylan arabinofuranohydrolase
MVLSAVVGKAQNPIIQTKFTADPAPMVYKDTVFLYTGHDEDDAKGFKMFNWLLYTSTDMVNWTDHGAVASLQNFSWAPQNGAWATQVIARNGKFYMYCPIHLKGIGVLVADSPYGPFKDPLGKPMIHQSNDDIDPTVFIDNDGQAYLYWGNPDCWYVKLNSDMTSYSGEIVKIDRLPTYQEGPWIYKRNDWYYLAFSSTCCPEGIGYAMSNSPTGPWTYKGSIMDGDKRSSGNHPGIIDYKGRSYVFGFNYTLNYALTTVHNERRSVCLEQLTYNPDGTIQKLPFWSEGGTAQVGTLNPFRKTQAETISWESGVKTEKNEEAGVYVTDIHNEDYIRVRGADFGKGATKFEAATAAASGGGTIEIHLDSLDGILLGICPIKTTGDWQKWITRSCSVKKIKGIHDIYFVFKGADGPLFNFNWWQFR